MCLVNDEVHLCVAESWSRVSVCWVNAEAHLYIIDGRCGDPGNWEEAGIKLQTLQRLKGQALAGRGVCFMHTGKHREALQDLQLGLQASPGTEHLRGSEDYVITLRSTSLKMGGYLLLGMEHTVISQEAHPVSVLLLGMERAELWLMEALWQLGRKEEVVSNWMRRNQSSAQRPTLVENTPG